MKKNVLEVSWGSLWRVAIIVALSAIIYVTKDVLVAILAAVIFSAGLAPLVDFMERKGVPRILGVLFLYVVLLTIIGLLIYAVLPVMILEFNSLLSRLVELTDEIFQVPITDSFLDSFNLQFQRLSQDLLPSEFSLFTILSNLFGGAILVISVAFISFYLSLSRSGVEWFLRAILPEKYEDKALSIFKRSKRRIGFWLRGQLLLSLIVGVLTFLGLWILGVKHAFVLAVVAGVFEIVPLVGPIFAGSIAVLVALSDSFLLGVYTVILFVVIQQFEGNIIIPALMHRTVGLHPVVILAAILIGWQLIGFVGVMLSVPVAVIVQEMLDDWISIKDHRRAMREVIESGK